MNVKSLGEFGLIAEIKRKFEDIVPDGVEGIGDDCAVIPKDEFSSYVVTTDMLVEGRHFLLDKISPQELGYKSLAVNISDVASMGAVPRFTFLSIAIPPETDKKWCEDFIEGYHSLSAEYNIALLGGDTTATDKGHLTISVTAVGEVENRNIKRRSAASIGDLIVVNTMLGESALALKMMMAEEYIEPELLKKHNRPSPQIKEGVWLGSRAEVHAMMDISDGVSSDLEHICKLSGYGATIYMDKIPHSDILKQRCAEHGWDPLNFSLSGGEDYGLLMTIDATRFELLKSDYFGELFPIGVITDGDKIEYINVLGEKIAQNKGFRHF